MVHDAITKKGGRVPTARARLFWSSQPIKYVFFFIPETSNVSVYINTTVLFKCLVILYHPPLFAWCLYFRGTKRWLMIVKHKHNSDCQTLFKMSTSIPLSFVTLFVFSIKYVNKSNRLLANCKVSQGSISHTHTQGWRFKSFWIYVIFWLGACRRTSSNKK